MYTANHHMQGYHWLDLFAVHMLKVCWCQQNKSLMIHKEDK